MLLTACDRRPVEEFGGTLESGVVAFQNQSAAVAVQQQTARRQEVKARHEAEARRCQAIEACFDTIHLQIRALIAEPAVMNARTMAESEAAEARLNRLARSKETTIGRTIIELRRLDFRTAAELECATRSFVQNYMAMTHCARLARDYLELGSENYRPLWEESGRYFGLALSDMRKAGEIMARR